MPGRSRALAFSKGSSSHVRQRVGKSKHSDVGIGRPILEYRHEQFLFLPLDMSACYCSLNHW